MATASIGFGPFSVSGYDPLMSFVEGGVNSYFDKKSEKRAFKRQLQLMDAQYRYAQRYAENSPSWNVLGLRNAGLNPILAVSNGANLGATIPSAPSVTSHKPTPSSSQGGFRYDPLISSQLKVNDATIDNLNAQGEAALLKAKTDSAESASRIAKLMADTAKTNQDFERDKNHGGYANDIVADVHRILNPFVEGGKNLLKRIYDDINSPIRSLRNESAFRYLENSPMTQKEFESFKRTNPDLFRSEKGNVFVPVEEKPRKNDSDGKKYYWKKISR